MTRYVDRKYGPYFNREDGTKRFSFNPFRHHLWPDADDVGFICNFEVRPDRDFLEGIDFDITKHIVIEEWS